MHWTKTRLNLPKENNTMELNAYFKSIIEQDREHVVICDLNHTLILLPSGTTPNTAALPCWAAA